MLQCNILASKANIVPTHVRVEHCRIQRGYMLTGHLPEATTKLPHNRPFLNLFPCPSFPPKWPTWPRCGTLMTWQRKQTYRLQCSGYANAYSAPDIPTHTRVEQPPNTPPYNCYDSPLHTTLQLCNMHLPMQPEGGRHYRTSGRSATMAMTTTPREHKATIPTMVNNQPQNELSIARVSNIVEDTQSQIGPVPARLTYMSIVASQTSRTSKHSVPTVA